MSIKVMSWVMDEAPVKNTTEMVVLYVLADAARDDGTCAWPSHATIAKKTRCSRRTVIRHINELERRGLIYRGDQRHVAHLPADKRPVVWNLNTKLTMNTAGCQDVTPDQSGVSSSAERGDNGGISGVSSSAERGDTVVTQPVLDPSIDPSQNLSASGDAPRPGRYSKEFEEFWKLYPRKADKEKGQEEFKEQLLVTDLETLMTAVKNYRAEVDAAGTAKIYLPMCKTWLGQERWRDYLTASKINGGQSEPSVDEIMSWEINWDEEDSRAAGF